MILGSSQTCWAERKFKTLQELQNYGTHASRNLKGNVHTVTTISVNPVVEFGQVVKVNEVVKDSIVFNKEGRMCMRKNEATIYRCAYSRDTIFVEVSDSRGVDSAMIVFTRDDRGRIISSADISIIDNTEKITFRQTFEYTPNGYKGFYYNKADEEAEYLMENNVLAYGDAISVNTETYSSNNKLIKSREKAPMIAVSEVTYKYDVNGNMIEKRALVNAGNRMVGNQRLNDGIEKWTYVYDEQGNWIEKHHINAKGINDTNFTRRVITYKTPEEIAEYEKAEDAAAKQFINSQRVIAQVLCDSLVNNFKDEYMESLTVHNPRDYRNPEPLSSFKINGDKYSFTFSDGETIENITFPYCSEGKEYKIGEGNLLSDDLRVVLIMEDSEQGPQWFVVKYPKGVTDFKFNPNASNDWVQLALESSGNKWPGEEKAHEVWENNIESQWYDSPEYELMKQANRTTRHDCLVNIITDPYAKNWFSPSLADKLREEKLMVKYFAYKQEQRRKQLCAIAIDACVLNEKGKPECPKVKNFSMADGTVDFKSKSGEKLVYTGFDTVYGYLPDGRRRLATSSNQPNQVLLNADCSLALVFDYHNIFIVQIENDIVADIYYTQLKDPNIWNTFLNGLNMKYKFL